MCVYINFYIRKFALVNGRNIHNKHIFIYVLINETISINLFIDIKLQKQKREDLRCKQE